MTESQHEIEKMVDFFNQRAEGYEEHMQDSIESFQAFYEAVASPIRPTCRNIKVMDLGSGTGLALGPILDRAPKAEVVAVDLSTKMLEKLLENYQDKQEQINVIRGSYLNLDFPPKVFDYAVSVMTLHHLPPEQKMAQYEDIRRWLKEGGMYIEGDYIVSGVEEQEGLEAYERLMRRLKNAAPGLYHIDVPLSIKSQYDLLAEAGFGSVETIWKKDQAAVLVARK